MDLHFKLVGQTPLIMHSANTVDPISQWAKAVALLSKKRKRSEQEELELSRREWFAGLYTRGITKLEVKSDKLIVEGGEIYIPSENLERMIYEGATNWKKGEDTKRFLRVLEDGVFKYKGPKELNALWDGGEHFDRRPMNVNKRKVMRTRPMFTNWEVSFTCSVDEDGLNPEQVLDFISYAGRAKGFMDSRPKYGQFEASQNGI